MGRDIDTGHGAMAKGRQLPGLIHELPLVVLVAAARWLGVLCCSFGLAFSLTPAVNGEPSFFTPAILGFAVIDSAVLGFCVFGIRRWRRSLLLAGIAMALTTLLATLR